MAKLLTPPEWYDQNGNLNNMLNCPSGENSVSLMAGGDNNSNNSVAIGWNSGCQGGSNSVAIGSATYIEGGSNSVAIGTGSVSGNGNVFVGRNSGARTESSTINNSVAIGFGATVAGDLNIQIGNSNWDYDVRFGKTKAMIVEYLGREEQSFTSSSSYIQFNGNPSADFAAFDISFIGGHYVIFSYLYNEALTPMWADLKTWRMIKIKRGYGTGIYFGYIYGSSLTASELGEISFSNWTEKAFPAMVTAHYYKGVQ